MFKRLAQITILIAFAALVWLILSVGSGKQVQPFQLLILLGALFSISSSQNELKLKRRRALPTIHPPSAKRTQILDPPHRSGLERCLPMDLFEHTMQEELAANAPLAARMRPRTLDEIVGQDHIIGKNTLLRRAIEADRLFSSIILYGPLAPAKPPSPR